MRLKQRINRLRRQVTPPEDEPRPVAAICNNPEAVRLGFDLTSERMALIGTELFEAAEEESTRAFHDRLAEIARSRNVMVISVGSDTPMMESRYDADGNLRVLY
jgi:hypothetical protein